MSRPSLVGQLVRDHLTVVAASCCVLVGAAWVTTVTLLHRSQDDALQEIAGSICHDITTELTGFPDVESAARHVFEEIQHENSRVEVVSRAGVVIAFDGALAGGTAPGMLASGQRCQTMAPVEAGALSLRACARWCGDAFGIRIVAVDVLHRSETKLAALGLLAGLPLAIAAGWLAGWVLFRRRLRPLHELRDATAKLGPDRSLALNVGARAAELADLEAGFNELLERVGTALDRERRFSREASHELRTPLTALRGRLENLEQSWDDRPDAQSELTLALSDVTSIDKLIEELLILARSESAPFAASPVNLCDVARHVAGRQAALDGKAARPPEVSAPDEILVNGNEELLEHAVGNLVDNARKYGGPLAWIRIAVSDCNGSGIIQVEDDGPGLRDDFRALAFESFAREPGERNRVSGAGLGLAIVRAIVRRHGGDVSSKRASLGGEVFRIVIPLLDSTPPQFPRAPRD